MDAVTFTRGTVGPLGPADSSGRTLPRGRNPRAWRTAGPSARRSRAPRHQVVQLNTSATIASAQMFRRRRRGRRGARPFSDHHRHRKSPPGCSLCAVKHPVVTPRGGSRARGQVARWIPPGLFALTGPRSSSPGSFPGCGWHYHFHPVGNSCFGPTGQRFVRGTVGPLGRRTRRGKRYPGKGTLGLGERMGLRPEEIDPPRYQVLQRNTSARIASGRRRFLIIVTAKAQPGARAARLNILWSRHAGTGSCAVT
jgi:hypothetical protein